MKLVIFLEHWEVFKIRLFTGWSDCACTPKHTVHTPNIRRDTELFKWTIGGSCRRERGMCHNNYFIKLLCFRSKWFFLSYYTVFFFWFSDCCKENENIAWRKAAKISGISIILSAKTTIFISHFNPLSLYLMFHVLICLYLN